MKKHSIPLPRASLNREDYIVIFRALLSHFRFNHLTEHKEEFDKRKKILWPIVQHYHDIQVAITTLTGDFPYLKNYTAEVIANLTEAYRILKPQYLHLDLEHHEVWAAELFLPDITAIIKDIVFHEDYRLSLTSQELIDLFQRQSRFEHTQNRSFKELDILFKQKPQTPIYFKYIISETEQLRIQYITPSPYASHGMLAKYEACLVGGEIKIELHEHSTLITFNFDSTRLKCDHLMKSRNTILENKVTALILKECPIQDSVIKIKYSGTEFKKSLRKHRLNRTSHQYLTQ